MSLRHILSAVVFVVTVGLEVAVIVSDWGDRMTSGSLFTIPTLGFAIVGFLLSMRRPDNRIGVVLSTAGAASAITGASDSMLNWAVTTDRSIIAVVISQLSDVSWLVFFMSIFVLLPLWFPTGKPLRGWGWIGWVAIGGAALAYIGMVLSEFTCVAFPDVGDGCLRYVENPWGLAGWEQQVFDPLLIGLVMLTLPAILGSSIFRYRRSKGEERLQIKWFVFAAAVMALAFLLTLDPVVAFLGITWSDWANVAVAPAVTGIPIAIGVAILRYRLYDINRIISRTVGYALVLAMLVVVYGFGAIWLPTRLMGERTPPLFVAGSTLVVAALFNPVRRRALRWVDRRFYRSRYDAELVASRFTELLRHQTDVDRLAADWASVVSETVRPSWIGIWVRKK